MSPPARLSLDSGSGSPTPPATNGVKAAINGAHHDDDDTDDPVQRLQQELERTREEKEALAAQYRNLLAKLTTMRNTLGNKLKQDAEELDRREQLVHQLTAQTEDLEATVETLKTELTASNDEAERAARELDALRAHALQESTAEAAQRERELREAQAALERCRIERDEWEREALRARVLADEARAAEGGRGRELEQERAARERDARELEAEREKAGNLQSVLEDFQAAKDHELRQAVREYEDQLTRVTQSLAEYKHRALQAELQQEESSTDNKRTEVLEKELRAKSLLIDKLRHEAVIMNEHLMEALRRLRRGSSDTNVDRRLVTNVLLSFLTTPRGDTKRFEMLSLLSSILGWNESERERAGLARSGGPPSVGSTLFARTSPAKGRTPELEKTDETESFSRLWVEFLLTEAASGDPASPTHSTSSANNSPSSTRRSNTSLPSTPTRANSHLSPLLRPQTLQSAIASSPNLSLASPPSRKGKERALDS
ncbi:hypothetical protein FA95DRAFT_1581896 [Auriscalpium vulgare]|uniref:Uncharacterized protein n=1 Tax=Auriscalpium vulgare TaxID=40419 RepID=A0ACB8RYG6_9AGAM|nr:hypothetical protein FA95DRAFT_1581896 [Auriscalpium vulgare]